MHVRVLNCMLIVC